MEDAVIMAKQAADAIRQAVGDGFEVCVILGSGLGGLAEKLTDKQELSYTKIPHFPRSTVESHAGKLLAGTLEGKRVLFLSGRFHFYEGYTFAQTAFPVRVMKMLGGPRLIVTNAAGGVNETFAPGDLMCISDHIKFFSDSPSRGNPMPEFGPRFFDLSHAYSPRLRELARRCADELSIPLKEGVYAFMPGPQFETPAEIRMLRLLGADAVGMSTVAEVIAANQCGIEVLGISCISNMAAGVLPQPVTDEEVVEVAGRVAQTFQALIAAIIRRM